MKNEKPMNPFDDMLADIDDTLSAADQPAPAAEEVAESAVPPIDTVSRTVVLGDDVPAIMDEALPEPALPTEAAANGEEMAAVLPPKPAVDWEKLRAVIGKIVTPRNLAIALCVLVVGVITYYILFPSRGYFHSDSADTLMWAQAAYDGGALLNPDFNYACLLPFGGQLLMVPLIAVFGVSMTTQVIGMLLFFALFVASLFFLFRQMKWGIGASCVSVSVILMILSGSDKLREIFWGHVIYYSLGLFFLLVGLGLTFKVMNCLKAPAGKRTWLWMSLILLVWCVLTATDQLETMTLFSVPLIGALIAERFFDFSKTLRPRETVGSGLLIAIAVFGTGAGYVLGNIINGNIVAGYAGAFSNYSGAENWFENFSKFFTHWTSLIGVTINDGDQIASFDGVVNVLRILLSILLLITPVIATILYPKIKDRASRIVILAHWVVTALVMVGFIFGRLSAANWRLSPILGTSLLVTMVLCRWIYVKQPDFRRVTCIAVIPLLLIGMLNMFTIVKMPANYNQDKGLYQIAETMAEKGWTYGYGTFWNANALTVISDSKVKCRSINVSNTTFEKYDYQQESSWYDSQPGQETYFVLLTGSEYATAQGGGNPLLSMATDQFTINEYYVLLFDHNIF